MLTVTQIPERWLGLVQLQYCFFFSFFFKSVKINYMITMTSALTTTSPKNFRSWAILLAACSHLPQYAAALSGTREWLTFCGWSQPPHISSGLLRFPVSAVERRLGTSSIRRIFCDDQHEIVLNPDRPVQRPNVSTFVHFRTISCCLPNVL